MKTLLMLMLASPVYAATKDIDVSANMRQVGLVEVSSTTPTTIDREPKEIIIQKNKIIIIYQ